MKANSSATEALKLKDLLAEAKVACRFDKCQEVGRMMSKILEKADECTNPTAADQAEAIKLLLKKHRRLVNTRLDPTGHVCELLENGQLRTIEDYDVMMSAITKELESASYVNQKMGLQTLRESQDEDLTHNQDYKRNNYKTNNTRNDNPNPKPPKNPRLQPKTKTSPTNTPDECHKCGSYRHQGQTTLSYCSPGSQQRFQQEMEGLPGRNQALERIPQNKFPLPALSIYE